ncbi:hypothetical protein [Pontivivens ytuae]|uniref:Na(+)-translocating NADH-quinone reductase subunit A n=1 Tax=Pontivivens ytuae TaxID=2789856 RepID=A0A7S9QDJ6_9RHOB|nr:hypothetical protein [Pontivivens ytuae]QPH54965.1 hypothetical protein I0K15_04165 [Pontivivens ytuae]
MAAEKSRLQPGAGISKLRPSRAALLGSDHLGIRPRFEVEVGDRVAAGHVLFRDRKHEEIAFVAPLGGRVAAIELGPRRTLSSLVVESDGLEPPREHPAQVEASTDDAARRALLGSGLWPAFRTRPFGYVPAPQDQPAAIVVNAVRVSGEAPDPRTVIARRSEQFVEGMQRLTQLTRRLVYLCREAGDAVLPAPDERIEERVFTGTAAAGLSGTQINRLHRAGAERVVWSVGYQDVIAIGHFFRTGTPLGTRIVSVAGPLASASALIETCIGANLHEVAAGVLSHGRACRLLSGGGQSGSESAYLSRFDDQITVAAPDRAVGRWRPRGYPAITPTANLDRALALDIHAVPLMRALSIGDVETAERLGCLELVEEDVVALNGLCTSGADYPRLLREVLDQLAREAA